MSNRTMSISEFDNWIIWIVALAIQPKTFDETRKLNRIWDACGVDGFLDTIKGKSPEQLGREPRDIICEETAFNFLLSQFEPTLGKLSPQGPVKLISSALLELHERLSK